MPTAGELARSAWKAGTVIIDTHGEQKVTLVRRVPRVLVLRCRCCGATWEARVGRNGKCKPGWRVCPVRHCNRGRLSSKGRRK